MIGPALSGFIVTAIGFPSMLICIAIICFLYAPVIYILKNPPAKEENMVRRGWVFSDFCFFS